MERLIKMFQVIVMILVLSSVVHGQPLTFGKESLKGLKGVYVLVEYLRPDIEKDGLSKSSILTDVELKLRMAGIKVLTKEEQLKEPGIPFLYVQVGSLKNEGIYAWSISVKLVQNVFLERDIEIFSPAVTWYTGSIEIAGTNNVDSIRDEVKDQVDMFINDYLAVNPKE